MRLNNIALALWAIGPIRVIVGQTRLTEQSFQRVKDSIHLRKMLT